MLNAELVENFHAIFRQRQSGTLNASGDDFNVRFFFQDGEVMAMDLGEDKEHLLADKLREYHRLDEAQHALVFATRDRVQGSVAEIVKNLHLASDDEIAQNTRSMVEDSLVNVFGAQVKHLQFHPDHGIDTFNFERSAVRLRIPVETLLKTVGQRVADVMEVKKAVGDWDAIFAFAEGGDGASALTDYEKHVLNFVDGHRSVADIASACRDSCLTLARVLNNLAKKSVIRRLPPRGAKMASSPGRTAYATPARGTAAPAAAAPSAAEERSQAETESGDDVPIRPAATAEAQAPAQPQAPTYTTLPPIEDGEPAANWGLRAGLVGVLVAVIGIGWAVKSYNDRRQAFQDQEIAVNDHISKREWNDALAALAEMKTKAGNDLSAVEAVKELETTVLARMGKEIDEIRKLIDASSFEAARPRLARLPSTEKADELRRKLAAAQVAFDQASNRLAAEVATALDAGDVVAANRLIAARSPREAAAASQVRDRWRVKKLEEARSVGSAIEERQRAVKLVRDASPSADQMATIRLIEEDIRRQEGRLKDQIKELQAIADTGDYEAALSRAEKLGTATVVKGTELEKAFQAFQSKCDQVKGEFGRLHEQARTAVAGGDAQALKDALASGDKLMAAYPGASRRVSAEELLGLLRDVIDASGQPADLQPSLYSQMLETRKLESDLVAAVKTRTNRLSASESEAGLELETARRLAKDGNWAGAERRYQDLVAKAEWRSTAAYVAAQKELADGRANAGRRAEAQKELAVAIGAGDTGRATVIAREIGLKYLPLAIESLPAGAEVWQGGKQIGTTPLVLDMPAADRVDFAVELRLPGYLPKPVSGAAAEGGWRIVAGLERAPAATAELGQVVTSRPAMVGAKVWVANRTQAFAVTLAGKVEAHAFRDANGPMPLNDPIYAPATATAAGVYLPARENVAIRVGAAVDRVPLGAATDLPIAVYESAEQLDTRMLVCAGTDGALHGVVETRPTQRWDTSAASPFSAGPAIHGDEVLAVHADGRLERVRAYDGEAMGSASLGAAVVAAWSTSTGFAGVTANEAWTWDGKEITREPLPQTAARAAKDVIVGINNRVWLRQGAEWKDLGRVEGTLTGDPVVWQGHLAVPIGSTIRVLGVRGFSATAGTDWLAPVAVGPKLVLIAQDGKVSIFDP